MALTPNFETPETFLGQDYEESIYPSKNYKMELPDGERVIDGRIRGFCDELEAMEQVIYKIINTERSTYQAYSDNYGIELVDLFGMPVSYCIPELERRIKEALTWDSRIDTVDNFNFEVKDSKIIVQFTAHTIFGDLNAERAVNI